MSTGRISVRAWVLFIVFSLMAVIPQLLLAQAEKGIALYNSKAYMEAEGVLREVL